MLDNINKLNIQHILIICEDGHRLEQDLVVSYGFIRVSGFYLASHHSGLYILR
ncbi:hypothetical protein BDE27_0148 [Xenorhabdus ehlersii]|uniref:Uncharacterized protein n=1 Tax=Xenorhabdus ehlersii TaxID=290111 RepID=A0A2D0IYR5_9GAMM|nr:hypothetical protein [Xenorhabdus sp. TS4]PHM27073.1 hypothetical protein Xehl_00059 [Xenorhabdus ehlersii]RKE92512.1 hypothetical protein BDE27_0148 [Xenorhabdus ehlersii]